MKIIAIILAFFTLISPVAPVFNFMPNDADQVQAGNHSCCKKDADKSKEPASKPATSCCDGLAGCTPFSSCCNIAVPAPKMLQVVAPQTPLQKYHYLRNQQVLSFYIADVWHPPKMV